MGSVGGGVGAKAGGLGRTRLGWTTVLQKAVWCHGRVLSRGLTSDSCRGACGEHLGCKVRGRKTV